MKVVLIKIFRNQFLVQWSLAAITGTIQQFTSDMRNKCLLLWQKWIALLLFLDLAITTSGPDEHWRTPSETDEAERSK